MKYLILLPIIFLLSGCFCEPTVQLEYIKPEAPIFKGLEEFPNIQDKNITIEAWVEEDENNTYIVMDENDFKNLIEDFKVIKSNYILLYKNIILFNKKIKDFNEDNRTK